MFRSVIIRQNQITGGRARETHIKSSENCLHTVHKYVYTYFGARQNAFEIIQHRRIPHKTHTRMIIQVFLQIFDLTHTECRHYRLKAPTTQLHT